MLSQLHREVKSEKLCRLSFDCYVLRILFVSTNVLFCFFGPKISRTFYFKLTEQSSRKKLAEGGFEPKNDMMQWRTKQPFAKLPWLIIEN